MKLKTMFERFKIKDTLLNNVVVITSLVLILLEFINTIITYSTLKTFLTSPIGNFLEVIVFSYIIYLLLTKEKTVEATFILLLMVLVPYGVAFIQSVLYNSLNLSIFSDIKRLIIFGLMVAVLIFFIKEIKKEIPHLKFGNVLQSNYFIISISFLAIYLIFTNVSPTLYFALFLYLFFIIDEQQLIPFALIYLTLAEPFDLIDTIIFEIRVGGKTITPFATWLNMILLVAVLVLAIMHIFKPTLLSLNKKEVRDDQEKEDN